MNRYVVTICLLSFVSSSSLVIGASISQGNETVMSPLLKEQIVPDVIDVAPNDTVEVVYPNGLEVKNGNELTPAQVKEAPSNVSWPADESSRYTLLMVDPDAPSRAQPTFREINHWLVVNINGSDVSSGETITPYRGSGPPKGTGLHRYIFLVYKQSAPVKLNETVANNLRENRRNFSTRNFTKENNLGDPIAANFYQAQFTEEASTAKP